MIKVLTSSIVLFTLAVEPAFAQSEQAKREAEQTQKLADLVLGVAQQLIKLRIESNLTKAARKEEQEMRAREIAKVKEQQALNEKLRPFAGLVDVFIGIDGPSAKSPYLQSAKFVGYLEIGKQTFARFTIGDQTWMVDTARIVAIRVRPDRPEAKKSELEKTETN